MAEKTIAGVNIWSGSKGLGGALTNPTELARSKGSIKYAYPVRINGREYVDAEEAYQALQYPGNHQYNASLMVDILAVKLTQHRKLAALIEECGGVSWLGRCEHITGSERKSAWEGSGISSLFISCLMQAYQKTLDGMGPRTHVVNLNHAPYDVYIGRANGAAKLRESMWHNPFVIGEDGTRDEVINKFATYIQETPDLLARLPMLKGKTLGCWCKSATEHVMCHGDVLAALVEDGQWIAPVPAQASLF